jgi:citrate lyase beta subunit
MEKKRLKILKGMKGASQTRIRESLRKLQTLFGATSVKLSTEDAAMSFEQIRRWRAICQGIIPVVVKIGGPNARNDIKQLINLEVDGLIAPMVESVYGLDNFVEALKDYTNAMRFEALDKHINIETIIALENLDKILNSKSIQFIDEITIGRKDLSKSMNCELQDPDLVNSVKEAVEKIRFKGIPVSVGGGINPSSIDDVLKQIKPQKFNTRLITFDVQGNNRSYSESVVEALNFEVLALKNDHSMGFISREEESCRSQEIQERLN